VVEWHVIDGVIFVVILKYVLEISLYYGTGRWYIKPSTSVRFTNSKLWLSYIF